MFRILCVALVAVATMVVGSALPAGAAPGQDALQARANRYLAEFPGSVQTSPTTIRIPGGELRLGTGETRAPKPCSFDWLCLWAYDSNDSVAYYYCGTYALPNWVGNGALENNQSTGTISRFKNSSQQTLWTSTAYDFLPSVNWTPVWYVTPC
ncbi:hypothetical protein [Actinokineospora cianjurensis]|nr:hypothetical protein [Actinokineospora cianjurensis]